MAKIDVDPQRIEAELKEFAGNTSFRVRMKPHLPLRVSIRETDKGVDIKINPKRIRTQKQLDGVMQLCQTSLHWD